MTKTVSEIMQQEKYMTLTESVQVIKALIKIIGKMHEAGCFVPVLFPDKIQIQEEKGEHRLIVDRSNFYSLYILPEQSDFEYQIAAVGFISPEVALKDYSRMDDSSQDGKLETIALKALEDTDLCICVYDASTMISEKERARTRRIHKMMSGNVVYAINCTNRLNSIDGVNQVEKLANDFFGAFHYSIPGMGNYYMICSAPKMIELDGFDKWLRYFVRKSNLFMLNRVRHNTGNGKISAYKSELSDEVQQYIEQIEQQIVILNEKHEEIIRQKQREAVQAAQKEVDAFHSKTINLLNEFADISFGLRNKIQECKDTGLDYKNKTKSVTKEYFIKRYKTVVGNLGDYFLKDDVQFIDNAFQTLSFPDEHQVNVKATGGETAGWAGAGGFIGLLVGGPIGAVVGATLGGKIGAADTIEDDSVDNTMKFISNTVAPLMKKAINDKKSVVSKNIKNKDNSKCSSGLEEIIVQTYEIQKKLNEYYEFCVENNNG